MTTLWPIEPLVAASDFNPFTRELAVPMRLQSPSSRPRPPATGQTIRPRRQSLLELGLACGSGAAELDAKAARQDAAERQADRASSPPAAAPSAGDDLPDGGDANPAHSPPDSVAPDPVAVAAMAADIQALGKKRRELDEELASLAQQQLALQAKLMKLLGRAAVVPAKEPTAAEGVPPGAGLPR